MPAPKRYESSMQKGLFYWVEPVKGRVGFKVVCQARGYSPSEAHDDWLAYRKDAEAIAEKLAKGRAV